jgi:hypothetical protein
MKRTLSHILLVSVLSLVVLVPPAWAVRADQTPVTPKGPYPPLPVTALSLDVAFTACDPANHDQFAFTGRELILARNAHADTAKWVTLESVAEGVTKRTGDITQYSLGAGKFLAFWAGNLTGWNQSGNKFFLKCESTDIKYAIIRIP